jgi:hypothetical protein
MLGLHCYGVAEYDPVNSRTGMWAGHPIQADLVLLIHNM